GGGVSAQELVTFAIVGVTAALFVRGWLRRRRRLPWQQHDGSGCGCPGAGGGSDRVPGPSIVLRGRKGERPEVIVRPPPESGTGRHG
ncbi:MAG TPA: hypothetical protein DCM86_06050, partial [Verrucomicrobiales bacterium]|nr:hypothetical protein [Verrucomicrobiales bacterium]